MVQKCPSYWTGDRPYFPLPLCHGPTIPKSTHQLFADQKKITPFSLKGIKITHLMFVGNILISIRGNKKSCLKILEALDLFTSSNLKVDSAKSEILIPNNCPLSLKHLMSNTLGFKKGHNPPKYLGAYICP